MTRRSTAADPAAIPDFAAFPVIGQAMMRSAWQDSAATLVGIKCGPFMGTELFRRAEFDWGTGHRHPDDGSFQLFAHGQFLTIDPGYTGFHVTANQNTMLFRGKGQLGEQRAFSSSEALRFDHYPELVHAEASAAYDYAVGEVAGAYPPALGVERFTRHLLFLKPDILLVADQLVVADSGMVYNYAPEELQVEGDFRHLDNGYVTGSQGAAWLEFQGLPGRYRLEAVYLDNAPEQAEYALEVDGTVVHQWRSHNQDRDDNLLELSPAVELKAGSRVALRGKGMAEGTRLTKLALLGPGVENPPAAEWLLHFDPAAEVTQSAGLVRVALGGAVLELYPLAPAKRTIVLEDWKVKNAEVEPFTFRRTRRLVLTPELEQGRATLLNLLHARRDAEPALREVTARVLPGGEALAVSWIRDGKKQALRWDLTQRSITLE